MAKFSAIRIKVEDLDLLQMVLKALPKYYDYFYNHYTNCNVYLMPHQLQIHLMLKESSQPTKL